MTKLTLRVVQGADRGRIYAELKTPITIGREEGNTIQLNDERISRFHCKIQEDNDHLVLTDLESTNGTRVNGQDCQLRILRFGDIIAVGRSVLLFGTSEQISARVQESLTAVEESRNSSQLDSGDFELEPGLAESIRALRVSNPTPQIPERLSPSQAAQLAELFEFFHARLGEVVDGVKINDKRSTINVDQATWQLILQMYSRISELIRGIADPDFRQTDH